MKDLLQRWLANPRRPYHVGVKLYVAMGHDKQFRRLITSEGKTPYKEKRLQEMIRDLLNGTEERQEVEVKQAEGEHQSAQTETTIQKAWPREKITDQTELALWDSAVMKLKEIAHLHSTLHLLPSDQERKEAAFRILRLDEDLDEVYSNRDYLQRHGHLPDTSETEFIADPFLMGQRIINLQRYIRRERGHLAKDSANAGAADRLKKFVDEYNYYAKKLGKEEIAC